MNIVIVGTGSTGWILANYLKRIEYIKKITIIGSSKIPSIGVGESTTLFFKRFLDELIELEDFTLKDFIKNTDAAVKYGVYYKNWSSKDFLHHFKNDKTFYSVFDKIYYGRLLANKDSETYIHDLLGRDIFDMTQENLIYKNENDHPITYHFDAAKFIDFFSKIALKDKKVKFIDATVVGGTKDKDEVKSILLENGDIIKADYFVFATGDSKINENFLQVQYESLSKYLLTDTAVIYPLKYTDKRKQFHPYTVAKTMKNGWRWITPTWSRIGTGYVFSSNHISVDEAIKEFKEDIGDDTISPGIVEFKPKFNKEPFHKNWCTIGMAHGFLEPLDAPGLTMTISMTINHLKKYLSLYQDGMKHDDKRIQYETEKLNDIVTKNNMYFWCTFILAQYKSCHRDDTQFWIDHKKVQAEFYDKIISSLDDPRPELENIMIQQTLAAKGVSWKTSLKSKPFPVKDLDLEKIHHLDYISQFHKI